MYTPFLTRLTITYASTVTVRQLPTLDEADWHYRHVRDSEKHEEEQFDALDIVLDLICSINGYAVGLLAQCALAPFFFLLPFLPPFLLPSNSFFLSPILGIYSTVSFLQRILLLPSGSTPIYREVRQLLLASLR